MSVFRRPTAHLTAALFLTCTTISNGLAEDYPCGSVSMGPVMKRLIPQEFNGANFRPVCRRHDRCYDTLGADKRACDRQYRKGMHAACKCSRTPIRCHMAASIMTAAVVLGGNKSFERAQQKARRLAARNGR